MESLYVCHFSNGHIKVGRSVYPKSRIASHADRVACIGVELVEHHIVECVSHAVPAEAALISMCSNAATKRNKSEWFVGLDYLDACNWADQCASTIFDPPPVNVRPAKEQNIALETAISRAGGITALMRQLNERGHDITSHNTIGQWRENGVPAMYCPDIEDLTGVRCEDLNAKTNWAVLRKQTDQETT